MTGGRAAAMNEAEGMVCHLSTECAICKKDFGERAFVLLTYCIAREGDRACNRPFCPGCSSEGQRRAMLCPEHWNYLLPPPEKRAAPEYFRFAAEDAAAGMTGLAARGYSGLMMRIASQGLLADGTYRLFVEVYRRGADIARGALRDHPATVRAPG